MLAMGASGVQLTLRLLGAGGRTSGPVHLARERPVREDARTGEKHYMFTGVTCDGADMRATPLLELVRAGMEGIEVSAGTSGGRGASGRRGASNGRGESGTREEPGGRGTTRYPPPSV